MKQLEVALRIATLNVRGLSARRRQCQLRRLFLENDLDVIAVQETKIESEEQTEQMVRQFESRYDVCVSHAVGRSGGVCIFLKNSLGIIVENVASREDGRVVYCDICFSDQKFRIICIYAPTVETERCQFFESIAEYLKCERLLVVVGDFNSTCAPEDRTPHGRRRDSSGDVWNELVNEHYLEDVAHCGKGTKGVQFTHFQGSSHARLDRAYVSAELAPLCEHYSVEQVCFSDHCLVTFGLGSRRKDQHRFN